MIDSKDFAEAYALHKQALDQANALDKDAVFDALARA